MSLKNLSERDGHAVDAILMNGRYMNPSTAITAEDAERIKAAYKVLGLLDTLPDETPTDLANRTLQRINGSSGGFPKIDSDRPRASDPNIA